MAFDLGSLLQNYLGASAAPAQAETHFEQAGMPNSLIAGMGPAVLASLLNKGGSAGGGVLGGLGGLLGQLTGGGATPQLTPAQASRLSPEQVQVIAEA